ncbi:MAG TPA: hypothetical protein DDZ80_03560 [Cyanobacteria bacterium UBA8803]|nr:hypothetical protein [Cyanobacteria bacterium UBA9273]HBL57644.1 hypothetical protein [Cyanobacteria bacterium UBA8803]
MTVTEICKPREVKNLDRKSTINQLTSVALMGIFTLSAFIVLIVSLLSLTAESIVVAVCHPWGNA